MLANDEVIKDQKLPFQDESESNIYPGESELKDYEMMDPSPECAICSSISDYNRLTYEMIEEIKFLRAEVIRWRQALIKYLSPSWADGLRQDIFDNVFQYFEEFDAYNWYVNNCCNGVDPLDNPEQSAFLARLKDGTDETSITYL